MARHESIAIGGFYATPPHLVPLIADMFEVESRDYGTGVRLADPCAGEGEAALKLALLLETKEIFACEMEKSRYEKLSQKVREQCGWAPLSHVLHGDAFHVEVNASMDVLYLNPPYDFDPVHGRLEQRFLERFTASLIEGGVLVFLVPYYALKASAELLAREYEQLQCFRFPGNDFDAFKQVVLFASKADSRMEPDAEIYQQVMRWAASVDGMPELGDSAEKYRAARGLYRLPKWVLRKFDLNGLKSKARVWRQSSRFGGLIPVPHILPDGPLEDLMFRQYPLATPPRPAHIASGIASGLFNGRKVEPVTEGLPDLLVKGVFDREYVTIEEKTNKDGDVTAHVQVQAPKLSTTVLDLSTSRYVTLKTGPKSNSTDIERMTVEDLLDHYGPSLMRVMDQQCPVMYDPKRDSETVELPPVGRKLFQAQEHASKALLKLLGGSKASSKYRRGKAAILLGEIGSGKTTCALTVAKAVGRRPLVMCPPHLLDSWTNEVAAVWPEAEVKVLSSVEDVDALREVDSEKPVVAVLSRETGKLGHAWSGVEGGCPKCGAPLPLGDLAKKRARCESKALLPRDLLAKRAVELAHMLAPYAPADSYVSSILGRRFHKKYLKKAATREEPLQWKGLDLQWVGEVLLELWDLAGSSEGHGKLFARLLLSEYSPEKIAVFAKGIRDGESQPWVAKEIAADLACLLPPRGDLQNTYREETKGSVSYYGNISEYILAHLDEGREHASRVGRIQWEGGIPLLDGNAPGSLKLALKALSKMISLARWRYGTECGEPLFQAEPQPRRVALSKYITRRASDLFDFLVLDEAHEYSSDNSAQEKSAHRLTELKLPTLLMTGSIMNGYAESLFANMWAVSNDFREAFSRDEKQRFIDRYGYRKRLLSEKDRQTGEILSFGSNSDRVERSERVIGNAPGLLPLFLFQHLLPLSVTLHKADLAIDLPPCRQIVAKISPGSELKDAYESLKTALAARIKADRFLPDYAGKLFGALAELPSYLDRATSDTGNQDDGSYEIRYPASLDSTVVAVGKAFPEDTLSEKEQWMIDTLRTELAEGRNAMVFCWHVNLLPRLAKIIERELGEKTATLYATKVATGKRQAWIDKNIVKKGVRIMLANPVAIQTGLNNLVHFSTEIWMENPACNPIILRQAVGRVDRIGQKQETRIYFPVYEGTLQEQLHELLLRKVAVSTSTDGLDPESALLAAGAADDGYLMGLSLGKQLWAMINDDSAMAA